MASDLSRIVKEILSSTLETTITKKTDVIATYNISQDYFQNKNIVSVDASFAYDQLTSNLKVIIPAQTASFIFNCMMMEEGPLDDEISDDTADAVKEVVSQISGGMETAINAENFEDLGSTKFSIGEFAVLKGADYNLVHKLILFKLKIEEDEFDFYVDFDEATVPFVEEIANSETLEVEELDTLEDAISEDDELSELLAADDEDDELSEVPEESTEEELSELTPEEDSLDELDELSELSELEEQPDDIEELEEATPQETNETEEVKEPDSQEETTPDTPQSEDKEKKEDSVSQSDEDKNVSDEEELSDEDKKNKKLKLIIYIVAGVLATVIIGFIVAYFMGVFDPPPPPVKKENNATKVAKKSMIIIDVKDKEIDYKDSLINEKRLNKRLDILTKYEILEEDVLEKFKQAEKERLHKLRMERLEEFAKHNKEESLYQKGMAKSGSKIDRFSSDDSNVSFIKKMQENEKLTFIKIAPLKYKKYKKIISREKGKSTSISICRNELGKVSIYIGPMYANFEVNNIVKNIQKKDKNSEKFVKLISLTQKEFDKMCDF